MSDTLSNHNVSENRLLLTITYLSVTQTTFIMEHNDEQSEQ